MSGGLRELWALPESQPKNSSAQADEFNRSFRDGMARLNRDLQQVAPHAGSNDHEALDANRQKLYAAYQKALALIDPTDPTKAAPAIERVLSATNAIQGKAAMLAANVQAGRNDWQKLEADFDAATSHIETLEDARHANAIKYGKIRDAIQSRLDGGHFQQAIAAFGQLQPKLHEAIASSSVQMAAPVNANVGTTGGATGATGSPVGGVGVATGATGAGAPSGGGSSGGGTSGPPTGNLKVFAVDPDRVVKLNKLDRKVFATVTSQAHEDAWRMHGMTDPVPIAYQVDNFIYVDDSRWPASAEKPTYAPHGIGGPKVIAPPSHKPAPLHFPNNPNHTLQGTSGEIGGGAGKGAGGTEAVSADRVAAAHRTAPAKTTYTFSQQAHEEIWAQLGNQPPAPIAFMQDGHMRVDVERYAREQGKWSSDRLVEIGLKPIEDAAAEAAKFRGAIETQRKQSADKLLRMQKAEPLLKAKVDAATGDEKKALAAKQALLAKEIKAAEGAVTRADADLKTIDNPGAKREDLLAILARQQTAGSVAEATEVTSVGLDPYKKGKLNKDVTTTTTSYADGQAKTESVRSQQKVGLDGLTKTETHTKEVTDGRSTATSTSEKKVNLSLDGKRTTSEKKSINIQNADGGQASLEVDKQREISSKGVSQTKTATAAKTDGSSVSKSTTTGVERGDGAVVGKVGSSVTKTDASGKAVTTTGNASGGITAGDGAVGATVGAGGGKSATSKKGRQIGANARLHANVSCKIGDPKGKPPLYPATLTVSFGASAGVSAGVGQQKGSQASAGLEIKGSIEGAMVVTHHLGEAALADYVAALEAASTKGGKVVATQRELAIISTGVNDSWERARQMYEALSRSISKETVDGLVNSGDSAKVSQTKSKGGALGGKAGPIGVRAGKSYTDSRSTEVKRNEAGGLDVAAQHEHGEQTDLSGSLNVGVVSAEVGTTEVHKRRFGYAIEINSKDDPDGKILDALNLCQSELDYEVFIATHFMKIKVISRSKGTTDAEGTNFGVSIAGQGASFGTHQGVDKGLVADATGKVISQTTVGTEGAGGKAFGLADSKLETATAETDAEGNNSLTLQIKETSNHGSEADEKKKQKALEKLTGTGKTRGALTSAAGGDEDDNEVQDIRELKVSNKELRRLGKIKQKSTWMGWMQRPWDEEKDWEKAWYAIRKAKGSPTAVAHALAEFIGEGRVERQETVRRIFRGGDRRMGKAAEYPDSLRDIRTDYYLVTDDGLPDKINTLANKQGDHAASKECARLLAIVDRILPRVKACKDFKHPNTKGEMMSELTECRRMLNEAVHGYGGNLKPAEDPKVLADEWARLQNLCYAYGVEQERMVAKLEEQDAYREEQRSEGRKLIRELVELQERWQNEVWRLEENYKKRNASNPPSPPYNRYTPQLKPHYPLVETYKKKFRMS